MFKVNHLPDVAVGAASAARCDNIQHGRLKPSLRELARGCSARRAVVMTALSAGLLFGATGCVLWPDGSNEQKQSLAAQAGDYRTPFDQRTLPDLPAQPTPEQLLNRALLVNGEVEAAYFDWSAAVARIQQAAAWPNTNITLSAEYMFPGEGMSSWDRTTLGAALGEMEDLSFPTKTMKSGQAALASAKAAGARFVVAKFDLQRKVLTAWYDYALTAEKVRIQRENLELLQLLVETARSRVQAGGQQQDLLKAQIEYDMARNELADMEAELPQMRAMLNAMLGRDPAAALEAPIAIPSARLMQISDADLIQIASDQIPELAALKFDVQNQGHALELARMQFIPDINPFVSITGSITQVIGAGVTLPTAIPVIRGAIAESDAVLRGTEAMARQKRQDLAGQFVASLYALRNNDRQVELLSSSLFPAADQLLDSSRQAYSTANIGFAELIDSQRTLLEVRQQIASARIAREKRLAELESLLGIDLSKAKEVKHD